MKAVSKNWLKNTTATTTIKYHLYLNLTTHFSQYTYMFFLTHGLYWKFLWRGFFHLMSVEGLQPCKHTSIKLLWDLVQNKNIIIGISQQMFFYTSLAVRATGILKNPFIWLSMKSYEHHFGAFLFCPTFNTYFSYGASQKMKQSGYWVPFIYVQMGSRCPVILSLCTALDSSWCCTVGSIRLRFGGHFLTLL